jgi:hypothetical protein
MNATYTVNNGYLGHAELEAITAWVKEANAGVKTVLAIAGAPLVGLVFVIALPLAGVAMLAWLAVKALVRNAAALKNTALFIAAPFIGLAYVVAFPVVGVGALVYFGIKAARN